MSDSISIPIPYTTNSIQVPRQASTANLRRANSFRRSTMNTSNRQLSNGSSHALGNSTHIHSNALPHPLNQSHHLHSSGNGHGHGSNTGYSNGNGGYGYISPLQSILDDLRRKHAAAAGPQNGVFGVDHHAMAAMNVNYYRQASVNLTASIDGSGSNYLQGVPPTILEDTTSSHHAHPSASTHYNHHQYHTSHHHHHHSHHQPNNSLNTYGYPDTFWMEFSVLPLAYAGDVEMEDMARRLCEEEQDRSWRQLGGSGKTSGHNAKRNDESDKDDGDVSASATDAANNGAGGATGKAESKKDPIGISDSSSASGIFKKDGKSGAFLERKSFWGGGLPPPPPTSLHTTGGTATSASSAGGSLSDSSDVLSSSFGPSTALNRRLNMSGHSTKSVSSILNGGGVTGTGLLGSNGNRERTSSANSVSVHTESLPSIPKQQQSIQPSSSAASNSTQTTAAPTTERGGDSTPSISIQNILAKYDIPHSGDRSSSIDKQQSNTAPTSPTNNASAPSHISYSTGVDSTSHAEHLLSYTPHLRHLTQASAEMQGLSGHYQTSRNILHYFRFPPSSRSAGESTGEGSSSLHGGTTMGSGANGMNGHSSPLDYSSFLKRYGENEKVAMELAAFLRVLAHEMTLEEFTSVEAEVFTAVFALMHSSDAQKRLAGVAGVDALIPVASSDEERKAMKFSKNIGHSLRANNVDYDFLAAVTKALGKMALGVDVDYVECDITRALEWLGKERSDRRLAAVLTLKELAQNAPAAFYSKTTSSSSSYGGNNEFVAVITPALRDPQPIVRVCAADALSECIKIIVDPTRKHHSTTGVLCQIYSTILEGFQAVKEKGNSQERKKRETLSQSMIQAQIEAAQHASLLAVGDMLTYAPNFMLPRFDEVTEHILALKGHPKELLRFEVLRLIPKLARQCPGAFSRRYLEESLSYVIDCATNLPTQRFAIDIRPTAYKSLGQLALAMSVGESNATSKVMLQFLPKDEEEKYESGVSIGIAYRMKEGDIYSKLDEIFSLVRNGLQSQNGVTARGINMKSVTTEALHCGADLVQALGAHAQPYVSDLLNDMFAAGLTEDLIHCLRAVAASLPSEISTIEHRLLEEICLSLAGTTAVHDICNPFSNWNLNGGNTRYVSSTPVTSPSKKRANSDAEIDAQCDKASSCVNIIINISDHRDDVKKIVLSLKTLGTLGHAQFDSENSEVGFTGTLLPFIQNVVGEYLSHPSALVRREAALTCCFLLLPEGDDFHEDRQMDETGLIPPFPTFWMGSRVGSASFALVERVLQKLLCVAVSDPSPAVRHCIVRAFDVKYDPHLCQAHHLPSLFLLLQDEALAVRAAALRLLGRLARLNPAPILPVLRRVLKELIIELRCSGDSGGAKEAATRLLIVFLRADALHRLVHPFLPSIIDALPMTGVAPRVASAALEALGELAIVVKDALIPWMHELLPHIMETMQDQSSASKQRTSLRTLGLIAGSTGYVVSPYLDYPQLLSQAADVLPATKQAPWALRREVIRTLGILGALDPYRYKAVASVSTRKGGGVGSGYFVGIDDEREINTNTGRQTSASMNNASYSMKVDGNINLSPLLKNDQRGSNSYLRHESIDGLQYKSVRNNNEDDDDDEPAHLYMYEQYAMTAQAVSKLPPAIRMSPSDEEFYPTVALQSLTRILKDPSLAAYHGMVMQAVMYIFNSLGLRCVPFLKRIVPHILHTARTCNQAKLSKALLQQVASLSGIVREHLRPYVPAIFEAVEEFWNTKHLSTVLELVEKMAAGVPEDFRKYVPGIVPRLLSNIEEFSAGSWRTDRQANLEHPEFIKLELILKSIRSLRGTLRDYMHLIIPALLKLADSLIDPTLKFRGEIRQKITSLTVNSIKTIMILLHASESERSSDSVSRLGLRMQYSSTTLPARVAQPLIRLLSTETNMGFEVGHVLVEALCICARLLGRDRWLSLYHNAARNAVIIWQDWANLTFPSEPENGQSQALLDIGSDHSHHALTGITLYDQIINDMLNDVPSAMFSWLQSESPDNPLHSRGANELGLNGFDVSASNLEQEIQPQQPQNHVNKHRINQASLERAWDVSQRATREDWDEWMRRFAVMLLKEAPEPVLRATGELANAYQPLARELFSAAFVCCWAELSDSSKESLLHALKTAFFADDVSPEILQTLLNLAEFMEHDGVEGGLPIDINVLAHLALKCRSYAKALHYKEREHHTRGGGTCIEDLISINKKLDLPEAALGVLKAAQVELERNGAESWKQSRDYAANSTAQNEFSSRIFHSHRGVGLAYSVMATSNEVSSRGDRSKWAGVEMQMSWLAKLGSWSDALGMYERKLDKNPGDIEAILGCMKCLDARGEWGKVLDVAKKSWDFFPNDSRENRKASKFCAQAAWRLEKWDDLETYSKKLVESGYDHHHQQQIGLKGSPPRVDLDGAFYSALLNIHRNEWSLAADYIDAARRAMDSRFTALMTESHKRAYPNMVRAQTLSEMEEIISYRKLEARAKAGCHKHLANRDDEVEARKRLVQLWRKRLAGCRVDAEVHSSILAVRSLVLGPTDEVEATLKLSALSRQAQSFKLGERVLLDPLNKLGADLNGSVFGFNLPETLALGLLQTKDGKRIASRDIDHLVTGDGKDFFPQYGSLHQQYCHTLIESAGGIDRLNVQHQFYYAYVKHLWAMGHTEEAMNRMTRLANIVDMMAHFHQNRESEIRVACWLKLGEWKIEEMNPTGGNLVEGVQLDALMAFKRATAQNCNGYKAWHAWALINFRLAQQSQESRKSVPGSGSRSKSNGNADKTVRNHIVAATQSFVQAICCGTKRWSASVQQDLLNFLTCLFQYADIPEVAMVINEEIEAVTLEAWLGVLPQLLARIHIKSPAIRNVLHQLLIRLGEEHPQALMYPLSVLLKSPVEERNKAAESLMDSLKEHSSDLVREALMVSSELIRVAILWLELWHEGLEDASRLYFGEGNVSGMLDVLIPLHEELERGPSTRREHDFHTSFGRDLAEAHAFLKEYIRLTENDGGVIPTEGGFIQGDQGDPSGLSAARRNAEAESALNQAWDLYYTVFRRINKQLPGLTSLELRESSPALLQAHNLELSVPGSYRVDKSYVKIERFIPSVQVITSKQRPRKIVLRGNDGKDYVFLLKGHEDLRQDERVMQLFGLVNALLARDHRTNKHDLNIQRYTIAPLSHNAGLVGWVPHCDTFHSLIKDYRDSKKIPLNMENREMLKLAPDYDLLTVMQKIEIFSEALDRTTGKGNDLYEVLWIKSRNSEEWLEHRTRFTRSLAVMSMVGYILGLGDRHPSNLMLDQISGRVLHIDFGDCFEVAMHREKFPEKIPFRLTRMLTKAMEVSGIEGSYRSTCENTMGVLRDNKDSLVAMLEAFVYDPLISWRLLRQESGDGGNEEAQSNGDGAESQTASTRLSNNRGEKSTRRETPIDRVESDINAGRSYAASFVHEPIQERMNEDMDDLSERSSVESDSSSVGPSATTVNDDETGLSYAPENQVTAAAVAARSHRSLQIYSDMQNMAATLSSSSRIASITGDGTYRSRVEGSLARSRVERSVRQREQMSMIGGEVDLASNEEALNEKALKVIRRVQDKLTGTDFNTLGDEDCEPLDVQDQVQRLIIQATSTENLCQLFIGWCAFW